MSNNSSIQILIVDDHAIVRQGLRMVLSLRPNLTIMGSVGTAAEALQTTLDKQPDLILLDLVLPERDGASLVPELRKLSPKSKILILSGVQDANLVRMAVETGVDGYTLKEVTPDELVHAITQVHAGESFMHPRVTATLATTITAERLQATFAREQQAYIPDLTNREQDVLLLMATQDTNREIAERLSVSAETVKTHVKGVLRKLGQRSRTQAVVEALRLGLIELN